MNTRLLKYATLVAFVFSSGFTTTVFAAKEIPSPVRTSVGEGVEYAVSPDLSKATRTAGGMMWTKSILQPDASFIKLHFVNFNLRPGDRLSIINASGRVVETLTGLGPKNRVNFWGLSAQGDITTLQFEFKEPYRQLPFTIDRMIIGDADLFGGSKQNASRSVCSPGDFSDAICYETDAGKWSNVQASVGVMSVGDNATTSLFCSGSNVSPNNYLMTNQHCIETQAACDNSEFVFKYYRTGCNNGSPTTPDWQSFRCDTVVAQEPFVSCDAGPGDLDFTLASVIGDPAATFGYAQVATDPVIDGEEIYIVQHPAGRPHEITIGDGVNVDRDGNVFRYYGTLDTEGGSSGSPIYRSSDDKLVGLHHCGGCDTPGVGNRGMLMTDIAPLISPFLCSDSLDLQYAGASGLVEVTGNGDTALDPGESWSFEVIARNSSCSIAASGVTGTVVLNGGVGSPVVINNAGLSFGSIAAGDSASSGTVTIDIPTDAECGTDIAFDLINLNASGAGPFSDAIAAISAPLGSVPVQLISTDTFDAGLADWTVVDGGDGSGPAVTWTTTNPGGRPLSLAAPYVIVDSDELGTSTNMDEQLISMPIDTTGYTNLSLQFNHDFNWYSGGLDEQGDVTVRSSATGGAWVVVQNYSGGNASGNVNIDISAYSDSDLQVRFHYYNASYEWWWAIDDVMLIGDEGLVCNVFGDPDSDGDGVADNADNCANIANPDQRDSNGDGHGNQCDFDYNNDCVVNFLDLPFFADAFNSGPGDSNWNPDVDWDGNNFINFLDLGTPTSTPPNGWADYFLNPPGPSANACIPQP